MGFWWEEVIPFFSFFLFFFFFFFFLKKTFCGFSMGRNQYWAGRVYNLCVYYMTGTPEGSTESGFMEKPGIEPATPGLQGIALIHYTTGASYGRGHPCDPKRGPRHGFYLPTLTLMIDSYILSNFYSRAC